MVINAFNTCKKPFRISFMFFWLAYDACLMTFINFLIHSVFRICFRSKKQMQMPYEVYKLHENKKRQLINANLKPHTQRKKFKVNVSLIASHYFYFHFLALFVNIFFLLSSAHLFVVVSLFYAYYMPLVEFMSIYLYKRMKRKITCKENNTFRITLLVVWTVRRQNLKVFSLALFL